MNLYTLSVFLGMVLGYIAAQIEMPTIRRKSDFEKYMKQKRKEFNV